VSGEKRIMTDDTSKKIIPTPPAFTVHSIQYCTVLGICR
jgi:hypothetical protein